MKESKAVYVTKHKIRNDNNLIYQLYTQCDRVYRQGKNADQSCQFDSRRDGCTCRYVYKKADYFSRLPKQIYTHYGRSFTEIGVGSVKALQRRRVRRVYLPETDDRGVGSSDLSSFILQKRNARKKFYDQSYYEAKKTSSKCVGGILEYNTGCVLSEKCSPIITTKSGTTSPKSNVQLANNEIGSNTIDKKFKTVCTQFEEVVKKSSSVTINKEQESPVAATSTIVEPKNENTQKTYKPSNIIADRKKAMEKRMRKDEEEKFSSDSLVQHVHNLEIPSETPSKNTLDPMENQLEREYRKIFATNPKDAKSNDEKPLPEPKSASLIRRRFQALRRSLTKRDEIKKGSFSKNSLSHDSMASHKDESVTSDPPSLEGRSYSSTKKYSPILAHPVEQTLSPPYKKQRDSVFSSEIDSDQGVRGMFKLWGKKFNLEDDTYGRKKPTPKPSYDVSYSYKDDDDDSVLSPLEKQMKTNISNKTIEKPPQNPLQKPIVFRSPSSSVEEKQPYVDKNKSSVDKKQPSVDKKQPSVDKKQPSVDKKHPSVDKKQPSVDTKQSEKDKIPKKEKKFFFFRKKKKTEPKEVPKDPFHEPSIKKTENVTAGRCEVSEGFSIKMNKPTNASPKIVASKISEESDEITRKKWLRRFLSSTIESARSVNVRWNNAMYATSSSTVFELIDTVYKNTEIFIRSHSEFTSLESDYRSNTKNRVNFVQDIQAWMMPKTITDRHFREIPVKINSAKDIRSNNLDLSISNHKWVIDKKTLPHKIELILRSRNINSKTQVSSEYLRIDIPKDFFDSISSDESRRNQTSDEEVYKIVEYESDNEQKKRIIKPLANSDVHSDIKVIVSVRDSNHVESQILETVIKRPPMHRDVIIQGSNVNIPTRFDVIGVGIITQRDMREMRQPLIKIQPDSSDNDSLPRTPLTKQKKCEFAESYLREYYQHWTPLSADLYSCVSESHLKSCSEKSFASYHNQGDGSKSCPNMFEDYLTSAVISSCSTSSLTPPSLLVAQQGNPCNPCRFIPMFKKQNTIDTQGQNINKRCLPKDSLEVFKKRKLYAQSMKSDWKCAEDKPVSVPSFESKCEQDACMECSTKSEKPPSRKRSSKKRVCLPDSETMAINLASQLYGDTPKIQEGILAFKGPSLTNKKPKHTYIMPYPSEETSCSPYPTYPTDHIDTSCDVCFTSTFTSPIPSSHIAYPCDTCPPPLYCPPPLPCPPPKCPADSPACRTAPASLPPPVCHPLPRCPNLPPPQCPPNPVCLPPRRCPPPSQPCFPKRSRSPPQSCTPPCRPPPCRPPPCSPPKPCTHLPPCRPPPCPPSPQICFSPPKACNTSPPLLHQLHVTTPPEPSPPSPSRSYPRLSSPSQSRPPSPSRSQTYQAPSSHTSLCKTPSWEAYPCKTPPRPCCPRPSSPKVDQFYCTHGIKKKKKSACPDSPKRSNSSCCSSSKKKKKSPPPKKRSPSCSPCCNLPPCPFGLPPCPSASQNSIEKGKKKCPASCPGGKKCKLLKIPPLPACPPYSPPCPPVPDSHPPMLEPCPNCPTMSDPCFPPPRPWSPPKSPKKKKSKKTKSKQRCCTPPPPPCPSPPPPCPSPPPPCPSKTKQQRCCTPPPCPPPPPPCPPKTNSKQRCCTPPSPPPPRPPSPKCPPPTPKCPPPPPPKCPPPTPKCPPPPAPKCPTPPPKCPAPPPKCPPPPTPKCPPPPPKCPPPPPKCPPPPPKPPISRPPSCPHIPPCHPCPSPCPPRPYGISLKMAPSNKCTKESSTWDSTTMEPECQLNPTDNITIRMKRNPSTDEIREKLDIKVQDEDGMTLYERKDYVCGRQSSLLKDMYKDSNINCVSTPVLAPDLATEPDGPATHKLHKEQSFGNEIEIQFMLRITQGDKTTEISIGKEEQKEQRCKKDKVNKSEGYEPEIYNVKRDASDVVDQHNAKNDISIKIILKNNKTKREKPKENTVYYEEFTKKISDKFHTVSTGYSDTYGNPAIVLDDHSILVDRADSTSYFASSHERFERNAVSDARIEKQDTEKVIKSKSKISLPINSKTIVDTIKDNNTQPEKSKEGIADYEEFTKKISNKFHTVSTGYSDTYGNPAIVLDDHSILVDRADSTSYFASSHERCERSAVSDERIEKEDTEESTNSKSKISIHVHSNSIIDIFEDNKTNIEKSKEKIAYYEEFTTKISENLHAVSTRNSDAYGIPATVLDDHSILVDRPDSTSHLASSHEHHERGAVSEEHIEKQDTEKLTNLTSKISIHVHSKSKISVAATSNEEINVIITEDESESIAKPSQSYDTQDELDNFTYSYGGRKFYDIDTDEYETIQEEMSMKRNPPKVNSKTEKKQLLKKVFQKAHDEPKTKDQVRQLRNMLKIILTDSSDNDDTLLTVASNELAKNVTYTSLKPNYFRDTDSMNNYYKVGSGVSSKNDSLAERSDMHTDRSEAEANSYVSINQPLPSPRGCMCSKVVEKINLPNVGGCCCRRKVKQDNEVNCNLYEEFTKVDYSDAMTQNSNHSKEITDKSSEEKVIKKDETKSSKIRNLFSYKNYKDYSRKLKRFTETNEHKIVLLNHEEDRERNRRRFNAADVLQCYETKKAVLEIYAQKSYSENGEHLVAKLPKFLQEKESEIERNYDKIATNTYRSVCTKNIFYMSVGR